MTLTFQQESNTQNADYKNNLDNVTKQQVGHTVHLLHFFKLISQAKTECLELQICVLTTFKQMHTTNLVLSTAKRLTYTLHHSLSASV